MGYSTDTRKNFILGLITNNVSIVSILVAFFLVLCNLKSTKYLHFFNLCLAALLVFHFTSVGMIAVSWTKMDLNMTLRDTFEWQNPWYLVVTPSMISAVIWGICYIIDIWAAMSNFHWLSFLTPIIKFVGNSPKAKKVLAFSIVIEIAAQIVVYFLFPNQPIRTQYWFSLISVAYVAAAFIVCTFCAIDIIGTLVKSQNSRNGSIRSPRLVRALINIFVVLSFISLSSMANVLRSVFEIFKNADVLLKDLERDDKRNQDIVDSPYNLLWALYGLNGFMCSLHVFYRIYQIKNMERTNAQVNRLEATEGVQERRAATKSDLATSLSRVIDSSNSVPEVRND